MKPDHHKTKSRSEYKKKHGLLLKENKAHKNVAKQQEYRNIDSDSGVGTEEQENSEFASMISADSMTFDGYQLQLKSEQLADSLKMLLPSKNTNTSLFQLDPDQLNEYLEASCSNAGNRLSSHALEVETEFSSIYKISMELFFPAVRKSKKGGSKEFKPNAPNQGNSVTSSLNNCMKTSANDQETIAEFLDDLLG